jgi:hypothetical protein
MLNCAKPINQPTLDNYIHIGLSSAIMIGERGAA